MPEAAYPYHEKLLHEVWQELCFNPAGLQTVKGEKVCLLKPGILNPTDGPDFLQASLRIGNIKWYGDIEIHWTDRDWFAHGHHKDPRYNRVVLHIVYEHSGAEHTASRQDDTSIPTIQLKGQLNQPLEAFLKHYKTAGGLPCTRHLNYISLKAFNSQIRRAHKAYFEQKVDDLMKFYNPDLTPSAAWKNLLATALWDGLGISHNREPMRRLCHSLYPLLKTYSSREELTEEALKQAGIGQPSARLFSWNRKSCRPANRPAVRVPQAASFLWFIHQTPFRIWLKTNLNELWDELNAQIHTHPGLGNQRRNILFGTVWLPSFYILGNLFGLKHLTATTFEQWMEYRTELPASIVKPFKSLPVVQSNYAHKLGTVYQLREWCKPRNCQSCKVFKSIISS